VRAGSVCGGLEGGNGGGLSCCCFFFALHHLFEQSSDGAFAFCDLRDFGARSDDAEGGVDDDLFYDRICGGLVCSLEFSCGFCGFGFGQVEAGYLEAVEEEAGAARVDVVCGNALEDFSNGGLDGGAVFR
jgi:hypothetical protein